MQRDLAVRAVQRLPPRVRLDVDRVAGRHEGVDVGDRVVHDVPVAVRLQVHGLVEVHGPRRVDGDELEVGEVQVGQVRSVSVLLGGRLHRCREVRLHVQLLLDGVDPGAETVVRRVPGLQHSLSHPHLLVASLQLHP